MSLTGMDGILHLTLRYRTSRKAFKVQKCFDGFEMILAQPAWLGFLFSSLPLRQNVTGLKDRCSPRTWVCGVSAVTNNVVETQVQRPGF